MRLYTINILVYPAPQIHSLYKVIFSLLFWVVWSEPAAVVALPLIVGGSANNDVSNGGAFTFNVNNTPANTNWNNGCGQSYRSYIASLILINYIQKQIKNIIPNAANNNATHNPHPLVKIARCRTGIVDRKQMRYEISVGDKISF